MTWTTQCEGGTRQRQGLQTGLVFLITVWEVPFGSHCQETLLMKGLSWVMLGRQALNSDFGAHRKASFLTPPIWPSYSHCKTEFLATPEVHLHSSPEIHVPGLTAGLKASTWFYFPRGYAPGHSHLGTIWNMPASYNSSEEICCEHWLPTGLPHFFPGFSLDQGNV